MTKTRNEGITAFGTTPVQKGTTKLDILNRTISHMNTLYKTHINDSINDDDIFIFSVSNSSSMLKYIEDKGYKSKDLVKSNFLETSYMSADRCEIQLEKQKLGLWYKETCLATIAFDINGMKGIFDINVGVDIYSGDRFEHLGGYIAIHRNYVDTYIALIPEVYKYNREIRKQSRKYDLSMTTPLSWNDLVMDDKTKEEIVLNIENFFDSKDFYREHNLPYKRGFIFVGPPGNGKSLCINVINSIYYDNIVTFHISPETEVRTIRAYFAEEIEACKLIIIEELDKITDNNGMLSIILDCIDGSSNKQFSKFDGGTITIATANEPEKIHAAFTKRPSRFDRIWKFDNPSLENKINYFQQMSKNYYHMDELRKIFGDTDVLSMAAVKEIYVDSHMKIASEKRHPTIEEVYGSIKSIVSQFKKVDENFEEVKRMGFAK